MKAFVPVLLGLCLLGGAARAASVKQRKPSSKELAALKTTFEGKELVAKKALYVSTKSLGAFLFAPVLDFTSSPPLQLHLVQDQKIFTTLPPSPADKSWPILRFEGVVFKDLNDDGYEDVVTLTRYMPVSGPKANQVFTQAALYMGRGGKSFELASSDVLSKLNDTPPPSMGEVMKRLKKVDMQKLAPPAKVSTGPKKP
ncbi:hypothetical protein [Hyalangium versicolor]|uniref:hypothetical protein n=1 Tax=Hyalangium versicolor TaxID=2861190 RepID=UPI001CCF4CB5|nr:hypothetical protein [Hyalangium versicolor]